MRQWPVTDIGGWPLVNESSRNEIKRIVSKIWTHALILYFSTRRGCGSDFKNYLTLVTGVIFHIHMRAHTFSFNLISKVKIRIFSKRKNELNDFWLLRRALFSRKEGKRYSLCITGRSKEVSEDVGWEISLGREWGKRSVVEILAAVFQTPFWSEENLRGRWCNEFSTIIASKVLNQKPFFFVQNGGTPLNLLLHLRRFFV